MIVEEAPAAEPLQESAGEDLAAYPLLVSARSAAALGNQIQALTRFMESGNHPLQDVALSLATTRTHFPYRAAVLATSTAKAIAALKDLRDDGEALQAALSSEATLGKTAFIFTGQGSQRLKMGLGLYEQFPVFKESLDEIAGCLNKHLDTPLLNVVFGEDADALSQTQNTQPALFALEVSHRLWESLGLVPQVVLGHSVGEIAAAHVAGVFSLSDACKLVAARGKMMQALPAGGAMASIGADQDTVQNLMETEGLQEGLDIAAVNTPAQTVVSGTGEAVSAMVSACEAKGLQAKSLVVSHAFHSSLMDPILKGFTLIAKSITYAQPHMPLISNVRKRAGAEVATAAYCGAYS